MLIDLDNPKPPDLEEQGASVLVMLLESSDPSENLEHIVDIPGLDRCFCSQCGQWIITDWGLKYLEELALKAKEKEKLELKRQIEREKKLRSSRCYFAVSHTSPPSGTKH